MALKTWFSGIHHMRRSQMQFRKLRRSSWTTSNVKLQWLYQQSRQLATITSGGPCCSDVYAQAFLMQVTASIAPVQPGLNYEEERLSSSSQCSNIPHVPAHPKAGRKLANKERHMMESLQNAFCIASEIRFVETSSPDVKLVSLLA